MICVLYTMENTEMYNVLIGCNMSLFISPSLMVMSATFLLHEEIL